MAPIVTLALAYVGFISLGLPDTVLGAAWPAMRAELGLPLDAAGGAMLLASAGVFVSSASSAHVRARVGTPAVLLGSTALAAVALATTGLAPSFAFVLGASFVAGLGGGAIDAALNDHVARHFGARHMNWLHASWGVGAAVAPAVVATTLHAGRTWRSAYLGLAVAELALGGAFLLTRRAWSSVPAPAPEHAAVERGRWSAAHTRRVLLFFFYTGVESGVGLWSASVLVSTRGATPARAGVAVALYWGGLTIGRLVFGLLVPRLGEARVLRAALACALVLLVTLAVPGTPLLVAQLGLAALGFSLGPVFPLLMHETPRRFPGADGVRLVGYQIAAASAGVATLPWVLGAAGRALAPGVIPLLAAALFSAALVLARAR